MPETTLECESLKILLDTLGISAQEPPKGEKAVFRIEFENHFTVEIHPLNKSIFRVSTRLSILGKSLEVQNSQILKALKLYEEVIDPDTSNLSLSISDYDNCLRLTTEIGKPSTPGPKPLDERLMNQLEFFASDAYAFKNTLYEYEPEAQQ